MTGDTPVAQSLMESIFQYMPFTVLIVDYLCWNLINVTILAMIIYLL